MIIIDRFSFSLLTDQFHKFFSGSKFGENNGLVTRFQTLLIKLQVFAFEGSVIQIITCFAKGKNLVSLYFWVWAQNLQLRVVDYEESIGSLRICRCSILILFVQKLMICGSKWKKMPFCFGMISFVMVKALIVI